MVAPSTGPIREVGGAIAGALARSGHSRDRHVPPLARLPRRRLAVFTFAARAHPGGEVDQWRAIKAAACEAIVALRGDDHPPPRRRARPRALHAAEVGETGLEALRALKERLDPGAIMNPGKLLPDCLAEPDDSAAGVRAGARPRRSGRALRDLAAQDGGARLVDHERGVLDRVAHELADRRSPGRSRRRRTEPGRPAAAPPMGSGSGSGSCRPERR